MRIVLLLAAGALGTLARYWLGGFVQKASGGVFPWGTFAVNMAGCFLFGLIWALAVAGTLARPTGTVVRRGAPLLDSASPTAEAVGTLREGEVVPILEASGDWVRVEDNAGARGWAHVADVRRLDAPPRAETR